jgi:DNA primase
MPRPDSGLTPSRRSATGSRASRAHRRAPRNEQAPRNKELLATSVGTAATVKQKLDIAELIGETVQLRKAGTTFKGLCPFHGEKTPSFVVTPARETWHCFGCGRGGDIFSFVMERDGVDFPTALRQLAGRAGVEVSERSSREDARRKRLRDALEAAVAFYHRVLTDHAAGQLALDYLRGRGFTDATIQTFQLGFAPESWDALTRALTTKRDFTEAELDDAGLATRRSGRRGVYDRFRGRIIFPIRDASGGACGLGGRLVGAPPPDAPNPGPKYLNTPATPLFDKSRTLYLIDRAKGAIRRAGRAVLVEGNTDALMAHQQGFENVVGSLGTALTAGHVELLTRYAPRIALAYDVDAAGQDAATFGATELTALVGEIERSPHRGRLTDVDVVRLPEGRDPDEVIRDTPDVWLEATEHPQPIMEFLIDRAVRQYGQQTASGKERVVEALAPSLRSVSDPVRFEAYVMTLARRIGVDERALADQIRRSRSVAQPRGGTSAGGRINLEAILAQPDALDPHAVEQTLLPVEATLLRLLLTHPELVDGVRARLSGGALVTTLARELWKAIGSAVPPAPSGPDGAQTAARPSFDRIAFVAGLEPTLAAVARTLYARIDPLPETDHDLHQAMEQSLLTLERASLTETIEFKRAELAEAEAAGDDQERRRLERDVLELQRQRLDLDKRRASTTLLADRRIHPTPQPTPAGGPA